LHRHRFECFATLEYWVIEKSPALIAAQQQRLHALRESWGKLYWRTWEDIPSGSITGCCFSNELVDAFPVHLIEATEDQLQEIYVTIDPADQTLKEVTASLSTPQLAEYFNLIDIDLRSDRYIKPYRTEVNLAALNWLTTVADRLQRGYLLTIDYGYPAHRYYSPTRNQGTLQCYYQHRHHSYPYEAIGQQDITTHVNFTALERQGETLGLQTIGFTQQGLFLMALGIGDRLNALSNPTSNPAELTVPEILKRRETLHALIDPTGLGNFGVLIQAKGCEHIRQPLKGLTVPPLFR
jgi:SAM-dependent MidA family methyltransferase